MQYQKPAETGIGNYTSIQDGGLLSRLAKSKTIGVFTAGSILAGCASWSGPLPGYPTKDSSIEERVLEGTIDNAIRTGDAVQVIGYPVRLPVKVVKAAGSIIYDRPIGAWDEVSKEADEKELPGIFKFIFAPFVYAKNLIADTIKYVWENPAEGALDAFIGKTISDEVHSDDAPAQQPAQQGGCFTSETKVAMSDGSFKKISGLKIGDKVQSFDFKNKKKVNSKVTALFTFDKDSFLHLNGLKVTEMHPFAVGVDKWKEAGNLKIGDQVLGNSKITIKNIKRVNKPVSVFNITVNGTHNYYVSDNENKFLVHNKGGVLCFIKESKVTMADNSKKNIEKIKIGDKVLGFSQKTKKWEKYPVTELQKGKKKGYYVINKKLKVSPVHQIYVNGKRKTAPEIKLNDTILNGHKKTRVTSIEYVDKKADRHNIVLGRNKDVIFIVNDVFVFNGW